MGQLVYLSSSASSTESMLTSLDNDISLYLEGLNLKYSYDQGKLLYSLWVVRMRIAQDIQSYDRLNNIQKFKKIETFLQECFDSYAWDVLERQRTRTRSKVVYITDYSSWNREEWKIKRLNW